jgi:hypothetical protein
MSEHREHSREVLEVANETIHKDRHDEYGSAEDSFARIAELWTTYLKDRLEPEAVIDGHDVAMLMVLLKVSRAITDNKMDTYVDLAGYAALGYRLTQHG